MVESTLSTGVSKKIKMTWFYFIYYWLIFGVGAFFGQFLPAEYRPTVHMVLFGIVMVSFFVRISKTFNLVISHLYALLLGVLSYTTFTMYMHNLGESLFYKNIGVAIATFIVAGIIGYFIIDDAAGWGKFLFVGLIALIFGSLVGFFIQIPYFYLALNIFALFLYILYTMYDFNRIKHNRYSPREMGFNLFVNLVMIIKRVLYFANKFKR
ncbi:Bax inhibitor-1 family protein [Abyssicoccus albus]|uniref:Inhibitor of apoptosis-promoting Bax1 n=1 Tax=Abyssicoccus albus TaxID=1817405 RepID=A0A3N5BIE9_9BACL|nr:Bax inhibitor-1 family protein [Abyssicoccus albus]RPF57407.1 hypothetical protein EDD62_0025 [Abyssicoccus albus]